MFLLTRREKNTIIVQNRTTEGGHTCIFVMSIEDNLFVGDALMNMFYPTVSMLYVDEQEMLLSAKYISELGEKTIYFGHGKPKRNREWVK